MQTTTAVLVPQQYLAMTAGPKRKITTREKPESHERLMRSTTHRNRILCGLGLGGGDIQRNIFCTWSNILSPLSAAVFVVTGGELVFLNTPLEEFSSCLPDGVEAVHLYKEEKERSRSCCQS
jgi:hypothetical protein